MKQVMVKQVRDYRAKGSVKRIQFIGRNYVVKLKAVELSRFRSQNSAKFFNIGQK